MKLTNLLPDSLQEVLHTIEKNKLRAFLTGLSVSWGIFIFIILLGAGNSLRNGIKNAFEQDAINTIRVEGGITSKEYKGLNAGRRLTLKDRDATLINNYFPNVDKTGTRNEFRKTVKFDEEVRDYRIAATNLAEQELGKIKIQQGRKFNSYDMQAKRKVAIIGKDVYKELFKDDATKLNSTIYIDDIPFTFIGMFDERHPWENRKINIPITTAQLLFGSGKELDNITVSISSSIKESKILEEKIRSLLSRLYTFKADDKRAINIENNLDEYGRTMSVLTGIKYFVALIGLFTLLSGITGISNIMFIVIKERKKEIGIRKALGAQPKSIIRIILLESILITTIAGYFGLFIGMLILDGLDFLLQKAKLESEGGPLDLFLNPRVDINMAILATLLLVAAGVLAGYFPARTAAKIKPIEALRHE